jgi:hypothetical protein
MKRWRNGLAVASVIWWHNRPLWAFPRMRSDARGYPWWPGTQTFRSRAGYRSARPITSKSSLSACNARPVHTEVPCVDGSELATTFFTPAGWSVQPCVRPFGAVHMTAGHNALRGSGPGQNRAFKDAVALMGCPDRRIDRLCITCCSPSQPSHHARYSARSRYGLSATG